MMQTQTPEDGSASRFSRSRRSSIDSDFPSSIRRPSTMINFHSLHPAPAYVALAAASQLATDHQKSRIQEELYDSGQPGTIDDEDALFSESALGTINTFLDHLLYSFLSHARSTSLSSLRASVDQVLKGKLARASLAVANEELDELQAAAEDELYGTPSEDNDEHFKNNLEQIFRRTRLRIMVYTRLGEMEDEEEEAYLQDEGLSGENDNGHYTNPTPAITPAATIFLTSVLEFIAEQCMELASQAAYSRATKKKKKTGRSTPMFGGSRDVAGGQRVVIEDTDVEKIALNSALGRLWRIWKKSTKSARPHGPSSPIASSPIARQLSNTTSSSTLRPSSTSGAQQELVSPSSDYDSRNSLLHTAVTRSAMRTPDGSSGSIRQYLGSNANDGAAENREIPPAKAQSSASVNDSYGYPTPAPSSQGSHLPQVAEEVPWHERRPTATDEAASEARPSFDGSSVTRSRRGTETDIAVPVSGTLTLHLPANGIVEATLNATRQSSDAVARHDFGVPEARNRDRTEQASMSSASGHLQMQMNEPPASEGRNSAQYTDTRLDDIRESTEVPPRQWTNDISNLYQPNSANTGVPLRVRVPGGGEYQPNGPSAIPPFRNFENSNTSTPTSIRTLTQTPTQTPKIVRVVTATQITPTSDMSYSASTDRHFSNASFEPITPFSPTLSPINSQISPRPKPINPPAQATGLSPREPRIQTDSTRDFADFIRSTAPDKNQIQVTPIIDPASPTASRIIAASPERTGARSTTPSGNRRLGASSPIPAMPLSNSTYMSQRTSEERGAADRRTPSPTMTRQRNPNLEPRDPIIKGRSNNDLISFLREGPPGLKSPKPTARENLERRVADKYAMPAVPGKTSEIAVQSPSRQESINSHSPLLQQNPAQSQTARQEYTNGTGREKGPGSRSGVRDPYAIPTDDEDEDILTALPSRARQQDSLIDFLNSTGPDPLADRYSLEENKKAVGLGLRDSAGKGLSLRPAGNPASPVNRAAGATSTWGPNQTAPNPMPQLGEFLTGGASSRTSTENTKRSMEYRGIDFDSQRANSPIRNRPNGDLTPTQAPRRTESKKEGVRGFFRKITA